MTGPTHAVGRRALMMAALSPLTGWFGVELTGWPLWQAFRHRAELAALGLDIERQSPALAGEGTIALCAELARRIGVDPGAPAHRVGHALAAAIRNDCITCDMVPVEGWPLASTEAVLARLAGRLFRDAAPMT